MGKALRKPEAHVTRKLKTKAKEPPKTEEIGRGRESSALLLLASAAFLSLSLYSYLETSFGIESDSALDDTANLMGRAGHWTAEALLPLLGWCSFAAVLVLVLLARTVWISGWPTKNRSVFSMLGLILSSALMAASLAAIASVLVGHQGGGEIGSAIAFSLVRYFNEAGCVLLCGTVFLLSFGFATGIGTYRLVQAIKMPFRALYSLIADSVFVLGCGILAVFRSFVRLLSGGAKAGIKCSQRSAAFSWRGLRAIPRMVSSAWNKRRAKSQTELHKIKDTDEAEEDGEWAQGVSEQLVEDDSYVMDERADSFNCQTRPEKPLITRGHLLEQDTEVNGRTKKLSLGSLKKSRQAKSPDEVPREAIPEYELPPLDLLVSSETPGKGLGPNDDELIANSKRLETALRHFRIGGRVTEVHPGPVITLYQFEPAAGIKVQRIVSLADDLALSLKVASVRVYAPVPGKGTVGIEVPNAEREMVRLRECLESDEFRNYSSPLPLSLGKNTYGEHAVATLVRMPHLLIAGATGTGKSVCINSLLMSLVYRHTPSELQLILIDPKMLELSIYEGIPHLKAPVITNSKRARGVLWWAVEEMERRYCIMKEAAVRDISMYNQLVSSASSAPNGANGKLKKNRTIKLEEKDVVATGSALEGLDRKQQSIDKVRAMLGGAELEPMPRIVIIVDELADLMLTVGREIEELITRLAQKARAAGIHLILATQRPSVNVITGLIKANFPARVSFRVASKIDARTVLDTSGSEKLLGQGDMLFLSPGIGRIKRLHAPFVSDQEVLDVVDWLRAQGSPGYDEEIERMIEKLDEAEASGGLGPDGEAEEYDALYDQAVRLVVEKGQASTSMVQRAFRIGYNRAARIIEIMERDGLVAPADGAKPRRVLAGASEDYTEQ